MFSETFAQSTLDLADIVGATMGALNATDEVGRDASDASFSYPTVFYLSLKILPVCHQIVISR